MGDHGKPYRTITPKHCQKLRSLIPLADIITPNITEACLLTDTPWKDGFWNESELSELCQRLHKLGPSKIVITGLPCLIHGKEGFENYLSCKEPFSQRACLTPSAGPSRHGTGDIFASILMGGRTKRRRFFRLRPKGGGFYFQMYFRIESAADSGA